MAISIISLTSNGLRDWLIQRVTSLVIAAYVIFLVTFISLHPQLDYFTWQSLHHHTSVKIFTLLTVVATLLHSWIGIWTVLTDYVKCTLLRLSLQVLVVLSLVGCVMWGLMIVWSVQ